MILAFVYFLIFCFILKKVSFFKDDVISFKFLLFILGLKVLAGFAYYWVYFDHYKSELLSDSESTMNGAKIIYGALPNHIGDFFKIIFGFHSESQTDPLYDLYFKGIDKWERVGNHNEFFLNDNRSITRINAVIMLFSFGYYAVHGFFMLALSFIGQWAFYKTFKIYFKGKEVLLAAIVFLTPSVIFWTSGVLKEPIAICLLGLVCYSFFKLFVQRQKTIRHALILIVSMCLSLLVKPYILIVLIISLCCFALVHRFQIKRLFLFYLLFFCVLLTGGIVTLKVAFNKDVIKVIVARQNDFINLSNGGIFFKNDQRYVRLDYEENSDKYEMVDSLNKLYRIKPHVKLMYWNEPNLNWDTVFVMDNQDTSLYRYISISPPAGSAIPMERLTYSFYSFARVVPQSLYNVLCKPFFYDARGALDLVASFENLLFLIVAVFCFIYRNSSFVNRNLLWFCIFLVGSSFLLVGLTTTVLGAIVRYKVPFLPFLLMIPLLFLDGEKWKKAPLLYRFFRDKS